MNIDDELVFLNGGHMKHQQAPKWLLTTALLAVLGANYGFQANSLSLHNENGLFEMSSETSSGRSSGKRDQATAAPTPTVTTQKPPTSGTAAASATVTASATATVSAAAEAKPLPKSDDDKTGKTVELKREGQVLATGTCVDGSCKNVVLEMTALEKFAANLASAVKSSVSATTTVAATPVLAKAEESEYDCDFTEDGKPETRAQKRDRLRCEKQEKERAKREDRVAKFEDKMEDIKDRCEVTSSESKLECLTREFNNALTRYSGRNAVPVNVVQRYFKNVVGSELSKMLFNSDVDQATAMSLLQDVFDGFPSEYAGIRQNILTAIQTETKTRAAAINQQYKLADTYAKQNKPQEYLQTMGEAQAAQAELGQMVNVYSAAARTSDSYTEDTSFANFYKQNYLPAMHQIFTSMGAATAAVEAAKEKTEVGNTRQNTRAGTTVDSTTGTRGQATTTNMKVNGQPSQWEFLNSSTGGVRVGAPSNTSRGNTRGARSMSN